MHRRSLVPSLVCSAWTLLAALNAAGQAPGEASPGQPQYQFRAVHDPDGIGKFYFGREIAQVMGHQGAEWLERPERESEEKPSALIEALRLKQGQFVADIGAGSGYLTWRLARQVGSRGRVYAVDIQREMLDLLSRKMASLKITNVVSVLGTVTDAPLPPNSVDLAIMVDVYHEFSHPHEMIQSICRAMKPGGRVVFVEYRAEDPDVPIKSLHKMTSDQVRKEMTPHPLTWEATLEALPWQHVIIFVKSDNRLDGWAPKKSAALQGG